MSDKNTKKKLPKELAMDKIFAFLKAVSLSDDTKRDYQYFGQSYSRNHLSLGWARGPYEEAIQATHDVCPNVSDKTIGHWLMRAMVDLFNQHNVKDDADPETETPTIPSILSTLDPKAIKDKVNDLLSFLNSRIKKWSAFVLIEGIELQFGELQLGTATLYQKNRGLLSQAIEHLENYSPAYVSKAMKEDAERCHSYLTIDVEGEDEFATHQAIANAQSIVDILNLYATSARSRASRQSIGIIGQSTITRRPILKCTPPSGDNSVSPKYSYTGKLPPAHTHEIDLQQVRHWKEHGFDKALETVAFSDTELGSVESRICSAIAWYGRACSAITQEEQFVALTTALESLLVSDEKPKPSITQRLADEVAALIGSNFESRQALKEKMRELYTLRCSTVHAGMVTSKQSLLELDELVAETIISFVCREIQD